MNKINKCYLCSSTYIIINYTTNKEIDYSKEKKLDSIFTSDYKDFDLYSIVKIIRTIFDNYQENTLRVTIILENEIVTLVYFSKEKIIKYIKRTSCDNKKLDISYTSKKGLNISSNTIDNNISKLINEELINLSNLEKTKGITLTSEDKILYKLYKLFYQENPDFISKDNIIKMQIMIYIFNEYISNLSNENFILYNGIPYSLEILDRVKKLSIVNEVEDININKKVREDFIKIRNIINEEIKTLEQLTLFTKYLYTKKYIDYDYIDVKAHKLVKKIDKSIEK